MQAMAAQVSKSAWAWISGHGEIEHDGIAKVHEGSQPKNRQTSLKSMQHRDKEPVFPRQSDGGEAICQRRSRDREWAKRAGNVWLCRHFHAMAKFKWTWLCSSGLMKMFPLTYGRGHRTAKCCARKRKSYVSPSCGETDKLKVECKEKREWAVEAKHLKGTDGAARDICACTKMSESWRTKAKPTKQWQDAMEILSSSGMRIGTANC